MRAIALIARRAPRLTVLVSSKTKEVVMAPEPYNAFVAVSAVMSVEVCDPDVGWRPTVAMRWTPTPGLRAGFEAATKIEALYKRICTRRRVFS